MQGQQSGIRVSALSLIRVLTLAGVGFLLYGDSVTLPFFFDDVVHFRWVEGNSLLGLWTGAASVGYYRPVLSTLWKLSLGLTGTFHPVLLHAVNVALHILNAALVMALTRQVVRGPHRRSVGLVAGLLFLCYPFSYQAVPWVSALCHPLVTSLLMGAVLTGIIAQSTSRWSERVLSLGMALVALFTHETGLIIGGWLLGYEVLCRYRGPHRHTLWWPLAYLALGAAYIPLYFSLPRAGSPLPPLTVERLTQNAAYLLQGLAFPIAPLARWTMDTWGWSDLSAAYLAAGLAVGLLVFLNWRQRTLRALGFALTCFALSVIPAWLTLPFNYIISGPRVLYLGSVGASMAWACGFQALATLGRGRWRAFSLALSWFLVGLTMAFGCVFVRTRQSIHHLGGDLIWQVSRAAAAAPAGKQLLVINYPTWLAPDTLVYPIGHEGVEFMPAYIGVKDLAWANSGTMRKIKTARFANALVALPGLWYGVRGPDVGWEDLAERLRTADQVYTVHFAPGALTLAKAGTLAGPLPTEMTSLAVFDDRVALVSAEVLPSDGHTLMVRLIWQAQGPLTDADYRIFAHVHDASNVLVAQSDGYAMDGLYPFWLWRSGEQIEEIRHFALADSHPSDYYRITVGIYDGGSGRRLPAVTPGGSRFGDDAVPILEIRRPQR